MVEWVGKGKDRGCNLVAVTITAAVFPEFVNPEGALASQGIISIPVDVGCGGYRGFLVRNTNS